VRKERKPKVWHSISSFETEKLSALRPDDYFRERAARADIRAGVDSVLDLEQTKQRTAVPFSPI
jgi:hypothetical protein